jgi:hypothetical protein
MSFEESLRFRSSDRPNESSYLTIHPQISSPVNRIAPNPSRLTKRSPPNSNVESLASGIAARMLCNPPVRTPAAPAEITPKSVLRLIVGKICCRSRASSLIFRTVASAEERLVWDERTPRAKIRFPFVETRRERGGTGQQAREKTREQFSRFPLFRPRPQNKMWKFVCSGHGAGRSCVRSRLKHR